MKKYFIRYQGMFWKPNACGYTNSPFDAGVYSEGEYGITASDRKVSSRGDYAVEVGQLLKDWRYTETKLEEMKVHLDFLKSFLG